MWNLPDLALGSLVFAKATAHATGKPMTFGLAVAIVLVWLISGAIVRLQRHVATVHQHGTTIVTFLMVFSDTEHAEPRRQGGASEARRVDSRVAGRARGAARSRRARGRRARADMRSVREACGASARRALRQGKPDTDVPRLRPGKGARRAKQGAQPTSADAQCDNAYTAKLTPKLIERLAASCGYM